MPGLSRDDLGVLCRQGPCSIAVASLGRWKLSERAEVVHDRSLYVEDSHFGGLSLDVAVVRDVRMNMGYRVLSTSGNRPLNYHQPYAGLVVPLNRRIAWTTDGTMATTNGEHLCRIFTIT